MVLQMLVFQHSLQHEYDKPGRAVVSSCVCIPPSGPSYVRTLTPRGTMVDSLYPTRLSPPSEPYSEALNLVSHKNGRGWMVGYRPRICASFPCIIIKIVLSASSGCRWMSVFQDRIDRCSRVSGRLQKDPLIRRTNREPQRFLRTAQTD